GTERKPDVAQQCYRSARSQPNNRKWHADVASGRPGFLEPADPDRIFNRCAPACRFLVSTIAGSADRQFYRVRYSSMGRYDGKRIVCRLWVGFAGSKLGHPAVQHGWLDLAEQSFSE